ncbi:hypothetical protein H8M03_01265 [Sphingomonas sabuli]|uniref:DUF308 domain-containing protein n=1 Tax=Sphingomonas sabuli TaxID=2764186 RepID=A0A7G9L323_9SPHN|nr:hypothetical protein [Sphingomonas sabuli]QNM83022.1 hypothetical protein H8M03_01265 [Sphingomonas sabuli]
MDLSDRTRTLIIRGSAIAILGLAVVAALLPLPTRLPDRLVIGGLLSLAGLIECIAVYARRGRHLFAWLAGATALVAGLRLALDPWTNYFTVFNLVILWLVVRSAMLGLSARGTKAPLCNWIWAAAAVDFLLALLLLVGLPIAVLVYGIFGQTSQLVATFAWILAASFAASGALLLVAAPLESGDEDQASG